MKKVPVIHGPTLNLRGLRETEIYGKTTLKGINEGLVKADRELGVKVGTFQSNHEREIVEGIQEADRDGCGAIVINPAAFTHTSVSIRDSLAAVGLPFFEVHISNIHAREPFRRKSLLSDLASRSSLASVWGNTGWPSLVRVTF